MNNLSVSVIIPVYKVEQYLRQCVDSILNQTYKNLEIILVDDGSPDKCPQICDEYAKQDSRIKVIHKENGGLSDARNVGLENAHGDYIVFIDSDDFWKNSDDMLFLVNKIYEYGFPDFIGYNMYYYYPETNKLSEWVAYGTNITAETDKDRLITELVKTGTFPVSAWSKIINRNFLVSNNIRFIKGILAEDNPWFFELLEKSQYIRYANRYVYCYRKQREGSITNQFSKKKYNDIFQNLTSAINNVQASNYKDDTKNALLSFCAFSYCILLGYHIYFERKERKKKYDELMKFVWLFDYDLNPKVKKIKRLYTIVGLKMTAIICQLYMKYKNIFK